MAINHVFFAFMAVIGAATGVIVALRPQVRDSAVAPYFWVLIAMALFELINFSRARGAPGTVITMEARLIALVIAIVLMVVIPIFAGTRLF